MKSTGRVFFVSLSLRLLFFSQHLTFDRRGKKEKKRYKRLSLEHLSRFLLFLFFFTRFFSSLSSLRIEREERHSSMWETVAKRTKKALLLPTREEKEEKESSGWPTCRLISSSDICAAESNKILLFPPVRLDYMWIFYLDRENIFRIHFDLFIFFSSDNYRLTF